LLLKSPQVGLFISHMGMGGFVEGVAAEVPFLCYPSGLDQYYNTQRAIEAGIAERIDNLDRLAEQVERVLDNQSMKDQSQHVAKAFRAFRGEGRALSAIDGLILRHRLEKEVSSGNQQAVVVSAIGGPRPHFCVPRAA
jgi:UDP:flavonoid glycosyltransferase YjiC (YdhE family)